MIGLPDRGYQSPSVIIFIESEINFDLRRFFQSLYEQSTRDLAYVWLKVMFKLQIGQSLTMSKSDLSGA